MKLINKTELIKFEDEIKKLYLQAKIKSPVHFSKGNENELIKIFKNINSKDWVFSTHRSHYHALLKGVPKEFVKKEILGNRSIHLNSKKHNFFTSAIVGGCLPIALGVAMGIKELEENNKVWVFIGDMCSEMGVTSECIKYASRNNLPINFVIEDNELSINTPTQKIWGEGTPIESKVLRYKYKREYPHHGIGEWINF